MTGEPAVRVTHPSIPGVEIGVATLAAFTQMWEPLGWVLADPEDQPDVVYLIPSTEKGAPFGVATLDASGNVVQPGLGGGGGVTVGTMNAAIAAAIALVTPASIGAHPVTSPIVLFVDDTLQMNKRATHPSVNPFVSQYYTLTDNSVWVMAPTGLKTQLAPGFVAPSVELALEKTVNSLTLSTVFTVNAEPNAVYDFAIPFVYESTIAASGERLRITFDPPPGSTGWYGVQAMNSTGAASGTLAPSWVAKKLTETFDVGGSGAAQPRYCMIRGRLFTGDHEPAPDAEAAFDFRARLTTLDGAGVPLVPAKIYGANTVDYDAATMTLVRLS